VMQVKYSHLDIVGRPVVVLEKPDVIPEHNLYFQVCLQNYYCLIY
jgi:oligosaccharyltransferase complex subunit alpha (ribophorin I)